MTEPRSPSGTSPGQPTRRLAAIMFTDLVGYSALAHRDEALAIELLELHRGWVREILPRHGGIEIETVGDAFLVEFSGALAAVECALAIQQRFADHNASAPENRRMQLRIGVHLGDIEHKDGKVMGDGVNIASRIHGVAEPGGICVSEQVYHVIRNRTSLGFDSLGRPALKNIAASLELFRLLPVGAPAAATVTSSAVRWLRANRLPLFAATVVVGIAGITLALWDRPDAPGNAPSVAVLPFANLSPEKDSDYFADGIHDAILTHLARIPDVKVTSRTSVLEYRNPARNLREISRALGVGYVVEGSVQRSGNRVRITAQLIQADNDHHVWAEHYDRELDDIFAIQSDAARQIAKGIRARLTPELTRRIDTRPTASADAYDLYLRARDVMRAGIYMRETYLKAEKLLKRAIAIDPDFALAHAALAYAHFNLYSFWFDHGPERLELIRSEAEAALSLQPALAEGHVAKARYFRAMKDNDGAIRELQEALRLGANADVHEPMGYVKRRAGRWNEALESLTTALDLDPRNWTLVMEIGITYTLLGEHRKAESFLAEAEANATDNYFSRVWRGWNDFHWKGDLAYLKAFVDEVPPGIQPGYTSWIRALVATVEGKPGDAIQALQECPCQDTNMFLRFLSRGAGTIPKQLWLAELHALNGNHADARHLYAEALELMEQEVRKHPDNAAALLHSAFAALALGRRDEALALAARARQVLPESFDVIDGALVSEGAALVRLRAGDTEGALDELERLSTHPPTSSRHPWRLLPYWKPFHANPRFQKLIAERAPER